MPAPPLEEKTVRAVTVLSNFFDQPPRICGERLLRYCIAQPHGGPSRAGRRDPLIVIVAEAALEIGLEFRGAAADEPGSVLALRAEQKRDAAAIRLIAGGNAQFMHGVEDLAGSIGIAPEVRRLRPSAVRMLESYEVFQRFF
jgi:hypothetical protein